MILRAWPLLLLLPATFIALSGCVTRPLSVDDRAKLAGKTFIVTGASSGIGRGVALELGRGGANVVVVARRERALQSVAQEVRALGGQALVVAADVTDTGQMLQLAQQTVSRFGRIDGWINSAGVVAVGRFEDVPLQDHQRILDVNLKGVMTNSYLAIRQFRAQGAGVLINVASVDGVVPHSYHASYSASKAGVISLGRVLNEELNLARLDDIHVVTVLPWAVDTPLWDHAGNYTGRVAQLPTMDGPEKVVNAIVRATLDPEDEIKVGYKAKMAYWSYRLAPDLTARFSAHAIEAAEVEINPEAPRTPGNLYQPVEKGQGVSGGIRERMKDETAPARRSSIP
ncbi:SDR family NAD(P)-dependent oxidoreductase [Pseudomonas sp. v388]|uniref:SDR family NAD(P)-dependent oxidoreductase n=1 Tax=Pseudomonas sp. v388 TaxID=2479849 RepID=UPI000F78876D|nr:SDR family NAD(P)-dependent oxidoreductase [Pseudomonas sp. v388]RRV07490.1 SDR family NAD(P)-dependent oxidoreductase [Pseudomonas sp. v388]